MNSPSAPVPSLSANPGPFQHPPCDELDQPLADSPSTFQPTDIDAEDEENFAPEEIIAGITSNQANLAGSLRSLKQPSLCKLLAMQRTLCEVTLSQNTEPKDKAACAKAWKELEILRYAKRGKPLAMNASVRIEAPKAPAATSPIILLPDTEAKSA